MAERLDARTTYNGFYHALSVTGYAEETFAQAVQWIEAHNREYPGDRLTVSRGILRLIEKGLEVDAA